MIMMMTMTTIHFSTLSTAKSYICCLNKYVLVIADTTHSIFSESQKCSVFSATFKMPFLDRDCSKNFEESDCILNSKHRFI